MPDNVEKGKDDNLDQTAPVEQIPGKETSGVAGQKIKFIFPRISSKSIADWLKVIGLAATTGAGIWAVFEPISNYVQERKRDKEVVWTEAMVKQLGILSDTSKQISDQAKNHAIFLLSAYELESLPFLLLELESSDEDDREVIASALKLIQNKEKVDPYELNDKVMDYAKDYFQTEYIKEKRLGVTGIINFVFVLGKLGKSDTARVKPLLRQFQRKAKIIPAGDRSTIETQIDRTIKELDAVF